MPCHQHHELGEVKAQSGTADLSGWEFNVRCEEGTCYPGEEGRDQG